MQSGSRAPICAGSPARGRWAVAVTVAVLLVPAVVGAAPLMSTSPVAQIQGDQGLSGFGEAAITAGDVNGDGFSDLIVGASSYDNGQNNEGQVRFYLGSASGIATTPQMKWEPDLANAFFGRSVTCLGDVTGDGFDDLAIGAPNYGASVDGAVFFYKGGASGPSAGANRTILGDSNNGNFGVSIAAAGDVNNDGFQDLLVGGSSFSNGQTTEGRALLFLASGGTLSTSPAWQVEGNQAHALFGDTVAGAGDVNGDGFDDLLVGAPRWNNGESSEGKAFLYLGSASGGTTIPAWQLEGNQVSANLGTALAAAGDVNGDGYADFLVGSSRYDNGNTDEGRVYLFLGSPGTISTSPARTFEGNADNAAFGASVGTAGDVNGDGFADFVIGATGIAAGGVNRGRVQLYLGSATLPTAPAFTYDGPQDSDGFGAQAITAGDTNGDGFSDLVIGATSYDGTVVDAGAVFLYRGAAAPPSASPQFGVDGEDNGDLNGAGLAIIGDVNGDGFDDALVNAVREAVPGRRDGVVRLYKGSEAGLDASSAQEFLSPIQIDAGGNWGFQVARAGDVNGDGLDDFLISDYLENSNGSGGLAVLYAGSSGTPQPIRSWTGALTELLGGSMTSGDFDGDGFFDVVLSSPGYDGAFSSEGRVRVYNGGPSGPDGFADWELHGASQDQFFGNLVSRAGDVNADGYDDLLVRSHNQPGNTNTLGQVDLYLGSQSGLAATPVWSRTGQFTGQLYGYGFCGAGDVNGDGFADVAIGSSYTDAGSHDGQVELFYGNAGGLQATPAFYMTGLPGEIGCGQALASAGDVNLDGFSDLLIGVPNRLAFRGGRVLVYQGGASGLGSSPIWVNSPIGAEDWFGTAVSGAGDFNGDGFSDFLIGAPRGESGEFVFPGYTVGYLGNEGLSVDRQLLQRASTVGQRVSTGGRNPLNIETIAIRSLLRSAAGRTNVRLEVDRRATAIPFGTSTHHGAAFVDTGTPLAGEGSVTLDQQTLVGFTTGISYHWRYRAECVNPFFPQTPWISPQGNSPSEADVRMRPITADVPDAALRASLLSPPAPNPMTTSVALTFSIAAAGEVRLSIHDVAGRVIKELAAERLEAGTHEASWDGRNALGGRVASGVYFARLRVGGESASRKILLTH